VAQPSKPTQSRWRATRVSGFSGVINTRRCWRVPHRCAVCNGGYHGPVPIRFEDALRPQKGLTREYKSRNVGSIVPALARNARTGHPLFLKREGEIKTSKAWHQVPRKWLSSFVCLACTFSHSGVLESALKDSAVLPKES